MSRRAGLLATLVVAVPTLLIVVLGVGGLLAGDHAGAGARAAGVALGALALTGLAAAAAGAIGAGGLDPPLPAALVAGGATLALLSCVLLAPVVLVTA